MEIITRQQALKNNLLKYFTGKPCKHGHISERYTAGRNCHECMTVAQSKSEYRIRKVAYERSYNQTFERKIKHKLRQQTSEYKAWAAEYQASPQGRFVRIKYNTSVRGKLVTKAYNDRQESRVARTTYRLSPEGRAHEREWRASPEGRAVILANNAKRRALHRACVVPLTRAEKKCVDALYAEAVLRSMETGEEYHVDHRTPLSRGGTHHPDNLWVVSMAYNLAKKDLTVEEFEKFLETGERTRQPII
jgi:hypothetical protein